MRLTTPKDAVSTATFGAWTLYELKPHEGDSFLWVKFKLMLPESAPAKHGETRVYRLAWNVAEQRFAKDRKLADLAARHQELYAAVDMHLTMEYGSDRLGKTPDEIAAERRRLRGLKKAKKAAKAGAVAPAGARADAGT
jgi:hypothetical protein